MYVDLRWSRDETLLLEGDVPTRLWTRRTLNSQASFSNGREPANGMCGATPSELTQVHVNTEYQGKLVVLVLEIL